MNISESEGTGISLSESEGTGIGFSETEGTDSYVSKKSKYFNVSSKINLLGLLLICVGQSSFANEAYFYQVEKEVYEGILVDNDGNTQQIEGLFEKGHFYGLFVDENNEPTIDSVDEGTGLDSVDEGTGLNSVDEGTGLDSVDEGTGLDSVDEGTGLDSVDEGTGLDSVDEGTGELIHINLNCSKTSSYTATIGTDTFEAKLPITQVFINGKKLSCINK